MRQLSQWEESTAGSFWCGFCPAIPSGSHTCSSLAHLYILCTSVKLNAACTQFQVNLTHQCTAVAHFAHDPNLHITPCIHSVDSTLAHICTSFQADSTLILHTLHITPFSLHTFVHKRFVLALFCTHFKVDSALLLHTLQTCAKFHVDFTWILA